MSQKWKNPVSIFVFILSFYFLANLAFAQENSTVKVTTSVLNLRSGPSFDYTVLSQLTKNKQLTILSSKKNWYRVKTNSGKIGWVMKDFVKASSSKATTKKATTKKASSKIASTKTNSKTSAKKVTTNKTASKKATTAKVVSKKVSSIKTASIKAVPFKISRSSEASRSLAVTQDDIATNMVSYAKTFLGVQYVWGGISPDGFDCSGFVQYVYKHFGIDLNRVACDQATEGTYIAKSDLIPGDLVFFDTDGGHSFINHVGMYIGDGQFIQASSGHGRVMLTDITKGFYANTYMTARRILN